MKNRNIIILGAARAGKSTLAQILHKEYNYSIISIDAFVSALKDAFPELGITHSNTENKFQRLPPFVFSYMKKIIYEYPEENFVLEGWHVYPKEIKKLCSKLNVKIICLGYTKTNPTDVLTKIRENEKENSYTKEMSDEKVKELIVNHIEYSKILEKQCNENNIKFYDTSFDRDNVLKDIIKDLKIEGNLE